MVSGACTTNEAWRVYDTMMSDDRLAYRAEPVGMEASLRELTRGFGFSPKLWQDACLAAFAIATGLRMLTFDTAFKKSKGLDCAVLTTQ